MQFEIGGTFTDIADGTYTATLSRVEVEETGGFDNSGYRKWWWMVDVGGVLTEYSSLTSKATGPKSKAYAWLSALLGKPLQSGEKVDAPIGQKALITIARNPKNPPYGHIVDVKPFSDPQQVIDGVPR